jgi:hypothetical protein
MFVPLIIEHQPLILTAHPHYSMKPYGEHYWSRRFAVGGAADQEMLRVVDDHRRELNIPDSKEMVVAITNGMSFELAQFSLCHVSLHIDAMSDTNKEGCHFVTVTSKDSYGKNVSVLSWAFLPSKQSWAYKWLF